MAEEESVGVTGAFVFLAQMVRWLQHPALGFVSLHLVFSKTVLDKQLQICDMPGNECKRCCWLYGETAVNMVEHDQRRVGEGGMAYRDTENEQAIDSYVDKFDCIRMGWRSMFSA